MRCSFGLSFAWSKLPRIVQALARSRAQRGSRRPAAARNARHTRPLAADHNQLSKQGEDRMNNHNGNNAKFVWSFLVGLLLGGLAGVVATLLLAPQSGKKTRAQIRRTSTELRDQTVKTVDGAVAQARGEARQITDDLLEQAGELQQRGQDVLDE
ncbi:MAG: YtxH domain-containing protein, partial [Chloroflexi bacterium]